MEDQARLDNFVVLLTGMQSRLYAYVFSLLGDKDQADDVLQETNLTLWKKVNEFDANRDFAPWAYSIARFEVMALRKKLGRDRLLFEDNLLNSLAAKTVDRGEKFEMRLSALRDCMNELTQLQCELIQLHYGDGWSLKKIAEFRGISVGAVAQALFRARISLMKCIERMTE